MSAQQGPRSAGATSAGGGRRRLLAGPLVMLLTPVLLAVSLLLPWYRLSYFSYHPLEPTMLNGLGLQDRLTRTDAVVAPLLSGALVVAAVAAGALAVLAVAAMVARLRPMRVAGIAMALLGVGFLATLGVLIAFLISGDAVYMLVGVWVYALAFVPALIGTMIVVNRHAVRRRYTANGSGRQT